ncbi:hypothetical protein ABKU57_23305, partial (plasmid) [Enterobacter kobei]|uniref:hypothetical protein n=1 Tax=Enterobacter kobei TaxID=208224 RepID=UPI0032AEECBB
SGGRSLWKNGNAASFSPSFLILAPSLDPAIREPVTPAAASRQERSDRVSEEASFHRHLHFALTHRSRIFPCHM